MKSMAAFLSYAGVANVSTGHKAARGREPPLVTPGARTTGLVINGTS